MSEQYDGPLMAQQILRLQKKIGAVKAERDAAAKMAQDYAREAYEDVSGLSAYASEHYQQKWDRDGDLEKWLARNEVESGKE